MPTPAPFPLVSSVPNEITDWSDPSGGPDNQLRVTVQGTVTAIDVGGFEAFTDGAWYPIVGVDLSMQPLVGFIFARDMTGSESWRVPDASKWHFANGQALAAPYSGDFT